MLEFRVASGPASPTASAHIPAALRSVPRNPPAAAIATRRITLDEYEDKAGQPSVMLLNRKYWHDPITESVQLNTTEIWEFINLTSDTHPMHLHLVRFQILDRRAFDPFDYLMYGKMRYTADRETPPPHEMGWKDVSFSAREVWSRGLSCALQASLAAIFITAIFSSTNRTR